MRKVLIVILFVIFTTLMFTQVNTISHAKSRTDTESPITSPITYAKHKISGKIYQKLFRWNRPIQKAKIVATNTQTKQVFTTYSNKLGLYTLTVTDGEYEVKAYFPYNKLLLPKLLKLNVYYDYPNTNFIRNLLPW